MKQTSILVLGAGKIGASIAKLLHHSGDWRVHVADRDEAALARLRAAVPIETRHLDVVDAGALAAELAHHEIVFSACSFDVNRAIAAAALAGGCSYFDLTEDVQTTREIRGLAEKAREGQVFMPQCGLAPGFIGILAHSMSQRFERVEAIRMRVGALPRYPHNRLKYNLTWSTEGLINEYCNPCEVVLEGRRLEVLPLEGLENFSFDGLEYEAFNTSGGLGTLCETLEGKVADLDYKTVRYPGHRYLMDFLVNGLKMGRGAERRLQLREILESALPITLQDVVLIFCAATGTRDGRFWQETDARKIYHQPVHGEPWSSIQLTTAAGACAALDLFRERHLPQRGFLRQEQIALDVFLANRFGRFYSDESGYAERVAS